MGQIFLKVFLIMLVLFAFLLPGFVLGKLKMLGKDATLTLSNVLLYVCQPALIISSFCVFSAEDWQRVQSISKITLLENFATTLAISFIAMGGLMLICKLVFMRAKDKKAADVYSFIAVFSNCGFMGVPFVQMFTDNDPLATIYVTVFSIAFNVLVWTLGVYLISGDVKEIRVKKLICNPTVIATCVALILFFAPDLNFFMAESVKELQIFPKYLAYATAPISMIIAGIRLAGMPAKEVFGQKGVYIAGGLRLVAAPVFTFAVALLIMLIFKSVRGGVDAAEEYVFLAPVIAMAMSPASMVLALAERYNGDKKTATAALVTDTILSLITIPLIITAITALWQLI